jgi:dolichyl-phosphate beta-glucosyltransferase
MESHRTELSIVIPAYNEASRLPPSLQRILAYCNASFPDVEIIVADDGSTDGTADVAKLDPRIRVVSLPHLGKGAAVRAGILASRGQWVLFTDSDLSTPIETLDNFWRRRNDADILIGSRALPGSRIRRSQSRGKTALGRLGNSIIQRLVVPGVHDTQCGFKMYHSRCRFIFERQRVTGWGFDFEILFLARKYGYRMIELPVEWTNDAASKVRSIDYLRTFGEIWTIHLNNLRGFYR